MFNFKNYLEDKTNNMLTDFINKIHEYDEYFFKIRDKKRYLVALRCNRTINTEIGLVTFKQRIYFDKINKKYYYPIYEKFNINKRAKMINDLKQEIISYLGKKKYYQDIQDILKYTYVSKVTISKIHKNLEIKEILPKKN